MGDRYDIGVDIGEGKDWGDKRTMSNDPIEPCSEETAQKVLRVLGAHMAKQLNLMDMEEKKTVQEWRDEFTELYAKMREELDAKDLDIYIRQNENAPVYVSFDIKL